MTSRDELFEPLEPPPGGLQRLRARLDAPRSQSAPIWIFAVTTCALALGAVALQASPREPVTVPPSGRAVVAVVRVPLRDERVVFYWVASATDPHWNGSDAQP